ncbi:MAG: YggT family protein [Rhodospirillales bacterium]
MEIILGPLFRLLDVVIDLYIWMVIISAILSLLVAFNVVNVRNRAVYMIGDFLNRVTEPALAPIRRMLPNLGGIDISPVILILLLWFLREVLHRLAIALGAY